MGSTDKVQRIQQLHLDPAPATKTDPSPARRGQFRV
jgi:hypothetical protein